MSGDLKAKNNISIVTHYITESFEKLRILAGSKLRVDKNIVKQTVFLIN